MHSATRDSYVQFVIEINCRPVIHAFLRIYFRSIFGFVLMKSVCIALRAESAATFSSGRIIRRFVSRNL